jgi:serine phosphatase RsbU (regulator of sigma subunit)
VTSDTRELGGWFLRLLPFVVMGIVAVLDVVEGPGVGYVPLLALGPAFASLSGGLRRMAVVGTLAVVLCAVLALYNGSLGDHQNILTFASIIGVLAASALASLIRGRNQRELADIRTVAEAAQRVLLRPVPQRVGPVQAAVRYISATARATIGGDLYEVATTPKGVRLVVGDVQGKGLDAVETAAAVLGAFREAAYDEADLAGVAARLEKRLVRQLTEEQFVTAVLAEMEADDHIILLNHGHPPPLMIRADGRVELVEPPEPAPPLGISSMAAIRPRESVVRFAPGDQLLFYTDGVIEARDARGTFYPLVERAGLLQDPDPEAALDNLQADLVRHAASPFQDDAAMLLLRHRSRWHPGDDTYPGDEGGEEPPVP